MTSGPLNLGDLPRVTFWPYDIFGYLLPGLVVVLGGTVANNHVRPKVMPYWDHPRFAHIALLVGVAYIIGHVVAALSARVFERWLLDKVWGYPTRSMFPPEHDLGQQSSGVPARVRAWLRRKVIGLAEPGYLRPYSEDFRIRFNKVFEELFGFDPRNGQVSDRFWLAWEYITIAHPIAYRRATHLLELYGFSRNTSMAFMIVSTFAIMPGWSRPVSPALWAIACFLAAFILFGNYAKLIRRMNDEVYRGFVASAIVAGRMGSAGGVLVREP